MLAVPALTAVTNPLELTVAINGALLLQAPEPPPNTTPLAVTVVVAPIHNGLVPPVTDVIATFGVTVIVWKALAGPLQPVTV